MSRQLSLGPSQALSPAFNGSGGGQAQAGPTSPAESWQITGVSVKASTNANEAVCNVYQAPAGPFVLAAATLLGSTSTGSSGDTFGPATTIWPGQQLVAIWAGGDPGAIGSLTYWGSRSVP